MAITNRGVTHTDHGSVTNIVISRPAGTVDDDEMWVHIVSSQSADTITPPSGWTEHADAANNDYTYAVYSKIAASEPSSWTWVVSSASFISSAIAVCGGTAQNETSPTISAVNANTVTVAPVTSVADSLLLFFTGADTSNARTWSNDEGSATKDFDVSTATENLNVAGFHESAPTAATYSRSFTLTGNAQDMHAVAVVIAPGAVAAVDPPVSRHRYQNAMLTR